MKCLVLSSVVGLLLIAPSIASAHELGADIEIISVLPRSPDVKPIAMSVPADGHHEAAAFASAGPSSSASGKLARVDGPKPVSSVSDHAPQR